MKRISRTKPLVVWIDDDGEYQQLVKEWLLPRYDVVTFQNGEEFLQDGIGLEPDLVLLDVRMPGPDGFALCRRIRGVANLRQVPLLFLTSCRDDETFIRHLDCEATGLLTKPVGKARLLRTIKELVDGQREAALMEADRR
jgi:DNA-binding response OmpR family regulator